MLGEKIKCTIYIIKSEAFLIILNSLVHLSVCSMENRNFLFTEHLLQTLK